MDDEEELITEIIKMIRTIGSDSEEDLCFLLKELPVGLALCDMKGGFVWCNEYFCQLIGYTLKELRIMTYWDITPKEIHNYEKALTNALKTFKKTGWYEKEYIMKSGEIISVWLKAAAFERGGEKFSIAIVDLGR